jgi:hypothetical protein
VENSSNNGEKNARHSGESRNPVSFVSRLEKDKALDDQLRCCNAPPAFAGMTAY